MSEKNCASRNSEVGVVLAKKGDTFLFGLSFYLWRRGWWIVISEEVYKILSEKEVWFLRLIKMEECKEKEDKR